MARFELIRFCLMYLQLNINGLMLTVLFVICLLKAAQRAYMMYAL